MTTLTFLGSHTSYQPTKVKTAIDRRNVLKYRGIPYQSHQPIDGEPGFKGLQFKGAIY